MDVSLLIRQRMTEMGLEQKDLAVSAEVTESYISQLLARKKAPPAPGRTEIYEKIGKVLGLAGGELSRLAELQRKEELRKKVADPPRPLFQECRKLVLNKCEPGVRKEVRRIFEKETFGELERLATQKLLESAQVVMREELRSEEWLTRLATLSGGTVERMRLAALEFVDTDLFRLSDDNCVTFLDPIVDSWDIELRTFALRVDLNRRLSEPRVKRFEFTERETRFSLPMEPGFEQFLNDSSLSGDASGEEIEFLKSLRFRGRHPSAIYFYRELQSLRDPLHFPNS